jgi:hypothetical protein
MCLEFNGLCPRQRHVFGPMNQDIGKRSVMKSLANCAVTKDPE